MRTVTAGLTKYWKDPAIEVRAGNEVVDTTVELRPMSNNTDPGASFDVEFQKPIVFRFGAVILVVGMGSSSARRHKISKFPQTVSRLEGSVKLTGELLPGYHELGEVDDCN